MPALLDDSVVIVLAGGAGERLYPLTKDRAKPAVYFGGPYRIIDFSLSNCINSGLRRIFIATQYKSLSLNRHIRMGETGQRALVPGNGRRGLPESLLNHGRRPALLDRALG
jgi:ADP-glucose pyrophosphorylase